MSTSDWAAVFFIIGLLVMSFGVGFAYGYPQGLIVGGISTAIVGLLGMRGAKE